MRMCYTKKRLFTKEEIQSQIDFGLISNDVCSGSLSKPIEWYTLEEKEEKLTFKNLIRYLKDENSFSLQFKKKEIINKNFFI